MTGVPLRPLERTILRLLDDGQSLPQISRRVDRKPGTVGRILAMIDHKSDIPAQERRASSPLRPVERVVLRLRANGESYGEIGNRLRKSGTHVRRIESYAKAKLDL